MEAKIVWLLIFVALYWAYCIFWGIKGARSSRTASDYFIAGRRMSPWVFVMATTAVSFSGWMLVAQPGMIHADGLPLAYLSLCAIVVPFTGLLFLKRQWIIGKRFGFVTPGEMLAYYFRSDAIRLLVVVVALVFSVPYLAVQLRAAGYLLHVLTDGLLSVDAAVWGLAAVLFLYVAAGGLRAVAEVAVLQCVLLAAGALIIGGLALHEVGGWSALARDLGLAAGTVTDLAPDGSSQDVTQTRSRAGPLPRAWRGHDAERHAGTHGHSGGAGVLDVGVRQPRAERRSPRSRSGHRPWFWGSSSSCSPPCWARSAIRWIRTAGRPRRRG